MSAWNNADSLNHGRLKMTSHNGGQGHTKYTTRHYEDIANILGDNDDPDMISLAFILLFTKDNPQFNPDMFLERIHEGLLIRYNDRRSHD